MFVPAPGAHPDAAHGRQYVLSGQALCVGLGDDHAIPHGPVTADWIYLGDLDGEPCFATALPDAGAPPEGTRTVPLRQLYGVLTDEDWGIAGRALGLVAWERDHRHCGRCGQPTARSATERARTCGCGFVAYPRISPAVIVAVEREGRLLLARNARTRSPFHSVLAGFVDVGESLEDCVARELAEEAGITVTDVRYFGSQPWPLTGSLMVGFLARWAGGELVPEPSEIFEAGWFGPHELPPLPGSLSIARSLIDDFVRRHT